MSPVGLSPEYSAAQFSVDYTMAVAKKAMDTTEMAAEELLEMLPATPAPAKGQYIDVYA